MSRLCCVSCDTVFEVSEDIATAIRHCESASEEPVACSHRLICEECLEKREHDYSQLRATLLSKLQSKEKSEGKRSITEADRRRWVLPEKGYWEEWEVPFDVDSDWPQELQDALIDYRKAWRAKMDEVNACIAEQADSEELVDQPEVDQTRRRVSGPFTVESEEAIETMQHSGDIEAYLHEMLHLLQNEGIRFSDNNIMKFATLLPLEGDILNAEGTWEDSESNVAVSVGPQHGAITATQVEMCLGAAFRCGYDELVFAGFSFEGAAQALIEANPHPDIRIHIAHINPDVAMGDLLKDTRSSQLFTVFGHPRAALEKTSDGAYIVKMEGMDIYDPVDNTVRFTGPDKVAAWFVDSDYDGETFCITQAFFPDKKAWAKIARALKGVIDADLFEKFSGTESLPFPTGEHKQVAIKVIDPRGNEVMQVIEV